MKEITLNKFTILVAAQIGSLGYNFQEVGQMIEKHRDLLKAQYNCCIEIERAAARIIEQHTTKQT